MANYYYVNSNVSTSAGYYSSKQTGSWPTTNFGSISGAIAHGTPPASGDFIVISDNHSYANSGDIAIPTGVILICTSATACQTGSTGGIETRASNWAVWPPTQGTATIEGLELAADGDMNLCKTANSIKVGWNTPGSGDQFYQFTQYGCSYELIDSIIYPPDITGSGKEIFSLAYDLSITLRNCSFNNNTYHFDGFLKTGSTGALDFLVEGCDLSNLKVGLVLIDSAVNTDDLIRLTLVDTKMPSAWTVGSIASKTVVVTLSNCANGDDRSVSGRSDYYGSFLTDGSVYADNADTVEGQTLSLAVETTTNTSTQLPFRFKIGSVRADFSTSKTITVELVHDDQGSGTSNRFTNAEAWIEVYRPNSSDAGVLVESNGLTNSFATATSNADSSETWTGTSMTSENTEKITLDTTTSGGEGWADVYICFGVASIGAADLFVSHDISVS